MPTDTLALRRTPYAEMGVFPRLFVDYATDFDALRAYFAHDYRTPEGRAEAARRAAEHPRDRAALVEVLLEQNERWGMDARTRAHIEALREDDAVAVVTGQQVGLLGGPLYTPLKTITTIQLARQMAEETGRHVVPVFWLEGEDHDLDEIAHARILRGNALETLDYTGHCRPEQGNLGPVGRLVMGDCIADLVDQLAETLPPTDFHEDLMAAVREAYAPGTTLRDAFARLMRALFPDDGLVFISPDDPRLKAMTAPLFRREIEDWQTSGRLLDETSARLEADGYHRQVKARPTNLFVVDRDGRHGLDVVDGGLAIRGTEGTLSAAQAVERLEADPAAFSPNVVLRPLMQDLLLPTAAYVAGPGEVSYFAQYRGLYEWAGLPMPVIYPRASATLVEGKIEKVLDEMDMRVPDLFTDPDALFSRTVRAMMTVDVDTAFDDASAEIEQIVERLLPTVEAVDASLVKAARAAGAAMEKEAGKLRGRLLKAERRRHDDLRARIEKAAVNVAPLGKPQERVVSILYFANKYGPDVVARLGETLDLDTTAHQVVGL